MPDHQFDHAAMDGLAPQQRIERVAIWQLSQIAVIN